jgi:tetratricopeptide (TPR) repeat protein
LEAAFGTAEAVPFQNSVDTKEQRVERSQAPPGFFVDHHRIHLAFAVRTQNGKYPEAENEMAQCHVHPTIATGCEAAQTYTEAMNRSLQLVPRRQGQNAAPPVDLNGLCGKALEHHQRGELAEAERIYRQVLDLDPRHADSLHLLGVLAHQVGRNDLAVELIRKAIARDKKPAAFHTNLGTALQTLGRLEEAAASYERALVLKPDMAEAVMNLGSVMQALGKPEEAEARFRQALRIQPNLAEAHVNLGNILQAQGKLEEAVARQERAVALRPEFAEAHFNHANALQALGRLDEAVTSYRQTVALKPGVAEFHGNMGNALLALGRLEEAEACYRQALALQPDYSEAFYNLGNLRQAQEKLEEAANCYRRAIELKPQLAEAHYNLGNTLHSLERLEEAAASFERALALRPDYAGAHYNRGCVLEDLGRLQEALAAMEQALAIKPEYPQARFGHALAVLRGGDFARGWECYESRWQSPDHDTPRRAYPQPAWRGERLEAGRLLLWGEQGIGDEIQFAGLIPDAVRTGNRIVLDCEPRLKPLFARSFPEVEVVTGCAQEQAQPAEIAAQLPTGSLPVIFRTTEAAFAATASPYLKADAETRAGFRSSYSDGRRLVGLAWHTMNKKTGHKRSIALDALGPLFALDGNRWISLQYGGFDALQAEAEAAHAPLLIDRTVDQFVDLDRFAAQIAALDLVITIDNSTAHLGAALGVPVWLLIPFAADWRWMERRGESPWYPTMRLYRQPKRGDWRSVLEAVGRDLEGAKN